MRATATLLFVIASIACTAQTKPKCDALASLLADSTVKHYLLKNTDSKMPVALFDIGNKYSGYDFPDCNSITAAGRTYSLAHGQDAYKKECKCTRMAVSVIQINMQLFMTVMNEGSLEVKAVFEATADGYALKTKELVPVADWVDE